MVIISKNLPETRRRWPQRCHSNIFLHHSWFFYTRTYFPGELKLELKENKKGCKFRSCESSRPSAVWAHNFLTMKTCVNDIPISNRLVPKLTYNCQEAKQDTKWIRSEMIPGHECVGCRCAILRFSWPTIRLWVSLTVAELRFSRVL